MDDTSRRIVALMDLGFRIEHDDGHMWIMWDENSERLTEEFTDIIPSKVYQGINTALDRVDKYLRAADRRSLLEHYQTHILGNADKREENVWQ